MVEKISKRKLSNNVLQTEEMKERVYSIKKNVLTNNNCAVSVSLAAKKLKLALTDENKVQQIMEAEDLVNASREESIQHNQKCPSKPWLCCQRRLYIIGCTCTKF